MGNQIKSLFIINPIKVLSILAFTAAALINMYIIFILITNRSGSFDGDPIAFIVATTLCVLAVILGVYSLSRGD